MQFKARIEIELSVKHVADEEAAKEAIRDWVAGQRPYNVYAGNVDMDLRLDTSPAPAVYCNTMPVSYRVSPTPVVDDMVGVMLLEPALQTHKRLGRRQRRVVAVDDRGWLKVEGDDGMFPANHFYLAARKKSAEPQAGVRDGE